MRQRPAGSGQAAPAARAWRAGVSDRARRGASRPEGPEARARTIAAAGGLERALVGGRLPGVVEGATVSEGLLLGLLRQGVRKYLCIFGHGNTAFGEALRVYHEAGLVRVLHFRNEVEMAHAATALRWQYGETPVVVTSIGPGALQAMAGSLAAASNGVGVYHLYGDETTHGEGYNMQQIPKREQGLFGRITATMGRSYVLHTGEALRDALRQGTQRVHRPFGAGPFYLLLPMNVQPARLPTLNLLALPERFRAARVGPADDEALAEAVRLIRRHRRIVIKAGGGTRAFAREVKALALATGGVVALSPGALGVLPDAHPRNMHVGGTKGSLSGNFAMARADLVIVVGSRAVCQADCSGTGYERAEAVININGDMDDATHYNRTVALVGDIGAVIERLLGALGARRLGRDPATAAWLADCAAKKAEWRRLRLARGTARPLLDAAWGRRVLTQPAAIKVVCDFAKAVGAVKYFDAGDVQANGFQMAEDDAPGETFTETGSSYMGFAPSALLAGALADRPRRGIAICGDGSFFMNPQVLIDAVEHGVRGTIVILDNRRMSAISSLQAEQYGHEFRTSDRVAVNYVALARAVAGVGAFSGGHGARALRAALEEAWAHRGLSVVHVPVYYGDDPSARLGAYGRWNVGRWCEEVQARYHRQAL